MMKLNNSKLNLNLMGGVLEAPPYLTLLYNNNMKIKLNNTKIKLENLYEIISKILKENLKTKCLNTKQQFTINFFLFANKIINPEIKTLAATYINNQPTLIFPEDLSYLKSFDMINDKNELDIFKFLDGIYHEMQHLFRAHPFRLIEFLKENSNSKIFNIVADSLINSQCNIELPNIWTLELLKEKFKLKENINQLKELTVEELINKLPILSIKIDIFTDNENFDEILKPENSNEEISKFIVKKIIEHIKQIGSVPSEVENLINKWILPKKIMIPTSDVERELQKISRTFDKPSQYNLIYQNSKFVLPAYPFEASTNILVIIDTSGSINIKTAELFFGFLKKLSDKYTVYYTEIDTKIKFEPQKFNKSLKELKFIGRGGTSFKDIESLEKSKFKPHLVLILTDGYVDEFPKNIFPNAKWYLFTTDRIPNAPKFIKILKIEEVENE